MKIESALGSKILEDLRKKFPEIPRTGVLAGGAVCDWFLDMEPNDIDVFVPARKEHFDGRYHGIKTAYINAPSNDFDEYSHTKRNTEKHLYSVVSSRRDGVYNIIACEGEDICAAKIITGFDLNATRVGIDLGNERLVWDESFVHFLKHRQLRVTAIFTPAHTAIRYFLKKERLGCKGDDALEMQILAQSWELERIGAERGMLPSQFGELFLSKAEEAMSVGLGKYFSIEDAGKFWTLHPKSAAISTFRTRSLQGILFPIHGPQALRAQRMDISTSYIQKMDLVAQHATNEHVKTMLDLFEGGYVRGKISERAIKSVCSFLNRRPAFMPLLMGLYVERQHQLMRRFLRSARRNGAWVYALIQNEATQLDVISDDGISAFVTRFEPLYSAPFKEISAKGSRNFLWYKTTELVSKKDIYSKSESFRILIGKENLKSTSKLNIVSIQSRLLKSDCSLAEIGQTNYGHAMVYSNRCNKSQQLSIGCQLASYWFAASLNSDSVIGKMYKFIGSCKTVGFNLLNAKYIGNENTLKSKVLIQTDIPTNS